MHRIFHPLLITLLIGLSSLANTAPKIDIVCDKADGTYKKGETIAYSISLTDNNKPVTGKKFTYRISLKKQVIEKTVITNDKPINVSFKVTEPGFVRCEFKCDETEKPWSKLKSVIYTAVDPENIKAETPCPKDFMAFWERQIKKMEEIPANAQVTPAQAGEERWDKLVKVEDIKLDCTENIPVIGYWVMPKDASKTKRYPVKVSFHGATYFPRHGAKILAGPTAMTKVIHFDVNPFGTKNGQTLDYYKKNDWQTLRGKLGPYPYRDWDKLERIYFNGMFLRVVRALQYAKSRGEWDGKNLIVSGSSMGGAQALVAAALDPQVTVCIANVPALGDHLAEIPGWPRLTERTKFGLPVLKKTAPYYDMVNFALQIKAKTLVGVGHHDDVCVPSSVWAIYNNLSTTKKMITSPKGIHNWNSEMRQAAPLMEKQWMK